jgi:light-regulated signal transduction histidine kinase (bacteriophytochrome)
MGGMGLSPKAQRGGGRRSGLPQSESLLGIELALCRQIVEHRGAHIWAECRPAGVK